MLFRRLIPVLVLALGIATSVSPPVALAASGNISVKEAKCLIDQLKTFKRHVHDPAALVAIYACRGGYDSVPTPGDASMQSQGPVATLRGDQLACALQRLQEQIDSGKTEINLDFDGCPDGN